MPDGTRRFRRCGVAIAKKNGKSTLLAGLSIYLMCADGEPGAEVYSAAADKKQASIIYNEAANMVDASPALRTRIALRRGVKSMNFGASTYDALSSEAYTKEGINIHALLFDEVHAQPNWDLWNTLRYGFAARRQPLLIWITTAGVYDPTALGWVQWQDAKAVQESRAVDISLLPVIYEASDKDDWRSEETWKKANPSYGITVKERDFREAVEIAERVPSEEGIFKRYRCNIWTLSATKWIGMEDWWACRQDYTARSLARRECWAGLDLAATTDLAALALLFPAKGRFRLLPFFWLPEAAIARRRRENRQQMDAWRDKWIKVTPGKTLDYGVIRDDMNTLAHMYRFKAVGIDPWNATQIATDLEEDGFTVELVRPTFRSAFSGATKEFERLVLQARMHHPGNPVLDWCLGNVTVEQDHAGNIIPSKRKSPEKIDGVVASIIATALHVVHSEGKKSVYEEKGVETL